MYVFKGVKHINPSKKVMLQYKQDTVKQTANVTNQSLEIFLKQSS